MTLEKKRYRARMIVTKKKTVFEPVNLRYEIAEEFKRRADACGMDYSSYLKFMMDTAEIPQLIDMISGMAMQIKNKNMSIKSELDNKFGRI